MSSPTADRAARFQTAVPPGLAAADIARRNRLVHKWRQHSNRIHLLRRLLPALCIVMLLALGGWALVTTLFWRQGAANRSNVLVIHMLKLDSQGRDDKGQPYTLTADSAVRDDTDAARVTMEKPVFTLGSEPDQTHVRARHGVYREDTRILNLTGDVHLDDSAGYHFVSEHAVIDTQKNNVDGEQHVEGNGPLGRIAASSYAVRDGGAHVFFTGQVKARFERHPAPGGATPAPAKR
jgi:lipopolysaccharide export system protein LptC